MRLRKDFADASLKNLYLWYLNLLLHIRKLLTVGYTEFDALVMNDTPTAVCSWFGGTGRVLDFVFVKTMFYHKNYFMNKFVSLNIKTDRLYDKLFVTSSCEMLSRWMPSHAKPWKSVNVLISWHRFVNNCKLHTSNKLFNLFFFFIS